jgi:SAM-dependent methyltransferase
VSTEEVRAEAGWLALREPADAAARSVELVDVVRARLPRRGRLTVHDLGCGSGAMLRWLAPRLPGVQHWVMHDRDPDLLALAGSRVPAGAADGSPVTVETHADDITRLGDNGLADADLVTASALLDMLTADEVERLVATCAAARCPVLVALSVTGRVELTPADPLDRRIAAAFNDHQRRRLAAEPLLGPDAVAAAEEAFARRGMDVILRASPWILDSRSAELTDAWLGGWVAAACEQDPRLAPEAGPYTARRRAQAAAGRLRVLVPHQDLLALPPPPR